MVQTTLIHGTVNKTRAARKYDAAYKEREYERAWHNFTSWVGDNRRIVRSHGELKDHLVEYHTNSNLINELYNRHHDEYYTDDELAEVIQIENLAWKSGDIKTRIIPKDKKNKKPVIFINKSGRKRRATLAQAKSWLNKRIENRERKPRRKRYSR